VGLESNYSGATKRTAEATDELSHTTDKSDVQRRGFFFKPVFHLPMVLVDNLVLVGGQIGLNNMVDDGNLTYFIIRYRYRGIDR
jgi:hypothetical protein